MNDALLGKIVKNRKLMEAIMSAYFKHGDITPEFVREAISEKQHWENKKIEAIGGL